MIDVDRFHEDGFLLVPGVFEPAEIDRFRAAVDETVARRGDPLPPMEERDPYDAMFTQYFNLWEDSAAVRDLTFEPRLAEIASRLVGAARLRVYCDQTFYKEPGSTETGAHQDYPLLCIAETDTVNAWIPLEGCGPDAGAIGYARGSHRLGKVTNVELALGRDPRVEPPLCDLLASPVYLEVPPGGVVFHHVLTFHVAQANRSEHTRKAFAITYVADGSTRGSSFPHASVDRGPIGLGERIEGAATPIVWPQPPRPPAPPPPLRHPPRGWPGYTPGRTAGS